MLTNGRTH